MCWLVSAAYSTEMADESGKQRIEINWVQTASAPLAAVTSAVLLSTVGVAGTIIGAALGSLAYTLGSSIYSHYIGATKDRVAQAQQVTAAKVVRAQEQVRGASEKLGSSAEGADAAAIADEELARADEELDQARTVLEDAEEPAAPVGWRGLLTGLPWKRIGLVAAGVFLTAMAVIVAFELVTGRAVSSYTGGSDPDRRTSIPFVGRAAADDRSEPAEEATPDDTAPGTSGRDEGTDTEPTQEEPSASVADASPTAVPSEAVSPSPSTAPTTPDATSTTAQPTDASP